MIYIFFSTRGILLYPEKDGVSFRNILPQLQAPIFVVNSFPFKNRTLKFSNIRLLGIREIRVRSSVGIDLNR